LPQTGIWTDDDTSPMSGLGGLDSFLGPDPIDDGCGETLQTLDVYVDLLLAGGDPSGRFPGVAAHLRDCRPCHDDFRGLLAAAGPPRRRPDR
jgi:hypothetical protein